MVLPKWDTESTITIFYYIPLSDVGITRREKLLSSMQPTVSTYVCMYTDQYFLQVFANDDWM